MAATTTAQVTPRTAVRALASARWLWPALLVLGAGLFNLLTLMSAPSPFTDEGWNVSRAWAMLQTGHPYGSLDSGVFERYPGYWTYFPWLGTAIHTVSVCIFGPNLFAVRVVSLKFCGVP